MNNDYTGVQSFPESDILPIRSSVNSNINEYLWRVRGGRGGGPTGSPGTPDGWSQNSSGGYTGRSIRYQHHRLFQQYAELQLDPGRYRRYAGAEFHRRRHHQDQRRNSHSGVRQRLVWRFCQHGDHRSLLVNGQLRPDDQRGVEFRFLRRSEHYRRRNQRYCHRFRDGHPDDSSNRIRVPLPAARSSQVCPIRQA